MALMLFFFSKLAGHSISPLSIWPPEVGAHLYDKIENQTWHHLPIFSLCWVKFWGPLTDKFCKMNRGKIWKCIWIFKCVNFFLKFRLYTLWESNKSIWHLCYRLFMIFLQGSFINHVHISISILDIFLNPPPVFLNNFTK